MFLWSGREAKGKGVGSPSSAYEGQPGLEGQVTTPLCKAAPAFPTPFSYIQSLRHRSRAYGILYKKIASLDILLGLLFFFFLV